MTVQELKKEFLPPITPEDFYILLAYATKKSREFLFAHPEYALPEEEERIAREYFVRRTKHEPIAYIIGEKEFYGRSFSVTRDTLIPRPETEHLVELALNEAVRKIQDEKLNKKILIADIGTGSGAIIITIATELIQQKSNIDFHATDTSQAALNIAKENAIRYSVQKNISFHHGNLIDPIKQYFSSADEIIITANLPYLSKNIYASTDDDVKKYEPRDALESGEDGLDHYRELFKSIEKKISPLSIYHLRVICEISPEQNKSITHLFNTLFPKKHFEIFPDLSGRSRLFSFRLNKG